MIDYRIQTFLTVCNTMNFRAAAELLNITQPAVSQHIHFLEDYYGCKLFLYNGRQLTMTQEALTLKHHAQIMSLQEKNLVHALMPKPGISLSIGATKTIGEYVIANQIAAFLKDSHNQIRVEIDNTARILELLDQGVLDFGLIEGYFDRTLYDNILYRKEPYVGFCSREHPFAEKTVPLNALWQEHLIVREEGSGTRDILQQLLMEHNHALTDFSHITCINNFGLLEQLVAQNCGITFAYQAAGIHNDKLAIFHTEGLNAYREFNYVFLPNPESTKKVRIFDSFRR